MSLCQGKPFDSTHSAAYPGFLAQDLELNLSSSQLCDVDSFFRRPQQEVEWR